MTYTQAVISEVLRLYPSVPKDGKYILKDDILPDGTELKSGNYIFYCPYAMGRLTSLWGKDALKFKPERFVFDPETKLNQEGCTKPSSFKFTAFQAGPRICLGQNLAYVEAKCALVQLVLMFEFKFPGDEKDIKIQSEQSTTLPIRGGLKVKISKRMRDSSNIYN